MMNSYLVLLGLIITCLSSGLGAATVRIRAYRATGEVGIQTFTLGGRLLLTCDVIGIPEGIEVVNYRWFHSLTGLTKDRYQLQDRHPYYRVVKGTLLMDVTSLDQGGKYTCFVSFSNSPPPSAATAILTVAGNAAPFLYTPTSLLPEHSVLTDVQQATRRNGQQWITCRSRGQGTRPEIWMGSELVVNNSTANTVTIGLGTQHPNGLYHCLSGQSQREYFSLFLRNSGDQMCEYQTNLIKIPLGFTLTTPTVSGRDTSMWTLTSPDGSRLERDIVEFECRVRNITFVEKYMSVSASGGTGRVATSVSCFGGQGQLYRVKVWAVSGPNISRALVCIQDGQCMGEGKQNTLTSDSTPSTASDTPSFGPHHDESPTGVGVSAGVFALLVLWIVVAIIVVGVVVRRKAARKQKRDVTVGDNPFHQNTAAVMQEAEMQEQSIGADFRDAQRLQGADNDLGDEEDSFDVGITHYEVADREVLGKNTMTQTPKESSTPASATKVDAVYAVVDKNKKKRAKKKTEDEPSVVNKDDLYAMPMTKSVKMTDEGGGMVVSGGVGTL